MVRWSVLGQRTIYFITHKGVSVSWALEINEITPTANPFLRTHWAKRRQMKEAWRCLLLAAGAGDIPEAKGKRVVAVYRYSRGVPDFGNLFTPIDKLIIDNLVDMKILVDDNEKWCRWWPHPVRGKERKTFIEIEEEKEDDHGKEEIEWAMHKPKLPE